MDSKGVKVTVTLSLNGEWISTLTEDELKDFVGHKINNSMGFRGQIKRISVDRKNATTR